GRLRRLVGRRSARLEEGAFVVEGAGLLAEAVAAGLTVEAVFAGPDAPSVESGGAPVYDVARGVIERVASTVTPQPVLAVVRRPDTALADVAGQVTFAVVLAGAAHPRQPRPPPAAGRAAGGPRAGAPRRDARRC